MSRDHKIGPATVRFDEGPGEGETIWGQTIDEVLVGDVDDKARPFVHFEMMSDTQGLLMITTSEPSTELHVRMTAKACEPYTDEDGELVTAHLVVDIASLWPPEGSA